MGEAEGYTTAMWQRHVGRLVSLMRGTEGQRRAFIDGFNGSLRMVHHTQREAYDRGHHTAILMGYRHDRKS